MAYDIRDLADEEVMQLVQGGDPRAFELIYDRHGGAAYSLAYRIVGKRAAAEDVVQEALISIWRSRLRYDRARERADVDPRDRPQPGHRRAPPQPRCTTAGAPRSRWSRSASRRPSART